MRQCCRKNSENEFHLYTGPHYANAASLAQVHYPDEHRGASLGPNGGPRPPLWVPTTLYYSTCLISGYNDHTRIHTHIYIFRNSPLTPLLGTSLTLKPLELYAARTSLQFFNFCSAVIDTLNTTSVQTTHSTDTGFMARGEEAEHLNEKNKIKCVCTCVLKKRRSAPVCVCGLGRSLSDSHAEFPHGAAPTSSARHTLHSAPTEKTHRRYARHVLRVCSS